jgi:hypothetical protein
LSPTVVVGFDDYPNASGAVVLGGLTDFYAARGAVFNGPIVVNYDRVIPGFAHSSPNAVESCLRLRLCDAPVHVDFAEGQGRVRVWVGYSSALKERGTIVLVGLDSAGARIAEASVPVTPSSAPIPVTNALEVTSNEGAIRQVEVRWDDPARSPRGIVVDDVEFGPADSLTVTPGSLDFGAVAPGRSSDGLPVTVTNMGHGAADIGPVTIEGADAFTVDAGCTALTLKPTQSCVVTVAFAPRPGAVSGPRSALLVVSASVGIGTYVVKLSGKVAGSGPATTTTGPTAASTMGSTAGTTSGTSTSSVVGATVTASEGTKPTDDARDAGTGRLIDWSSPLPVGAAFLGLVALAGLALWTSGRAQARPTASKPIGPPPMPRVALDLGESRSSIALRHPALLIVLLLDPTDSSTSWIARNP